MAKKRYHQSVKDRMAESRGMERRMEREEIGKDYSRANRLKNGMDPRRYQEMRDAGMIQEDHKATANLPQEVRYHAWPANNEYPRYGLDDTIRGIDYQEDEDYKGMEKHLQKGKY